MFIVRGDFLADTLHVKPARTERGIGYYTESQYALICRQLISPRYRAALWPVRYVTSY